MDASLSGTGAWWENNAYTVSRQFSTTWGFSITQLKRLNVLVLLRPFECVWANQAIHIHIDNQAVVHALKQGKIKDKFIESVAKGQRSKLGFYVPFNSQLKVLQELFG